MESCIESIKCRILILSDLFLPGFKGGGPIVSIANIVEYLKEEIEFYIITKDRDIGESTPYENIIINEWQTVDKYNIVYLSPYKWNRENIEEYLNSLDCNLIYLNSFFSKSTIIVLNLLLRKRLKQKAIIIAPRGQFSPGALKISISKYIKKMIYINIFRALKIEDRVLWQATSQLEKEHIKKIMKRDSYLAVNIGGMQYKSDENNEHINKVKYESLFVYISRITPKKNLLNAIKMFKDIDGKAIYDIYGPIEDKEYWEKCKREIDKLPQNVIVNYRGMVLHDQIPVVFRKYHFFLFPTLGENYGHIIAESIASGCPVIISDQTPWRNLEIIKVGWDIPLVNLDAFTKVLQHCVEMGSSEYNEMCVQVSFFSRTQLDNKNAVTQHRNMFIEAYKRFEQ